MSLAGERRRGLAGSVDLRQISWMTQVSFTENLRRHVECPPVSVSGATAREVLDAVFADNPMLKSYILDDQGRVRRHVNVFINGDMVSDPGRPEYMT